MKKTSKKTVTTHKDNYLIDTHCHLDMGQYTRDLNEVIGRAEQHNIRSIITVGTDEESSIKAVKLAQQYQMLFAAVGVHPHEVESISSKTLESIAQLADDNPSLVVGYGEIGLDYMKNHSPPRIQRQQFRSQLALAKELQLPIIIHDRDAHEDTLAILNKEAPFDYGGVMHCFSSNYEFARQIIDLGLHISIPGIVTFKKSQDLQDVATKAPLSSMLLETDGPFLAPEPFRGRRNEPHYILYTAEKIALLRDVDINEIARQTSRNAQLLFRLPH